MSNERPNGPPSLKVVQGHMSDQTMPSEVQDNIRRHYEHLKQLADTLNNLGMDEHVIEEHVLEIFREYKNELAANIRRIKAAEDKSLIDHGG